MLVSIQFPIADARSFIRSTSLRLEEPYWPNPQCMSSAKQFVHYFGDANEREREPDISVPDEYSFCGAHRALRFHMLETQSTGLPGKRFYPVCAYRRLFCDGQAVARVEIGIAHARWAKTLYRLSFKEIVSIVQDISLVDTWVPVNQPRRVRYKPAITQGRQLASLFSKGTMNRNADLSDFGEKLVTAGDPIIVVELKPHEIHPDALRQAIEGFTLVPASITRKTKAFFSRLKTPYGSAPLWILHKGKAPENKLRSLRLCLLRTHAEREVLDHILGQIQRGNLLNPGSEEAVDLLDEYFIKHIGTVQKKVYFGIKQSGLVLANNAMQLSIRPAVQAQLLSRYKGCRRQVWRKIDDYQAEHNATRLTQTIHVEKGAVQLSTEVHQSGTGNVLQIAEYMNQVSANVTNSIQSETVPHEVSDLIQQLKSEMEKISDTADESQIRKMGKNLEALSKETANSEPDRRWYEVSLEGIKEAAEAIGGIAAPIMAIVAKLSPFLL